MLIPNRDFSLQYFLKYGMPIINYKIILGGSQRALSSIDSHSEKVTKCSVLFPSLLISSIDSLSLRLISFSYF